MLNGGKGKVIVRNPSEDNRKQNIVLLELCYSIIDTTPS